MMDRGHECRDCGQNYSTAAKARACEADHDRKEARPR